MNGLERVVWNALAPNRQRTKLQRRSTAPKQSMGAKPNHISKAPKAETQNLKFLKCYSTKLRGYLVSQIRFWTLPNHLRDVELPHPKRASRTPLGLILRGLLGHNQQMWWWSPRLPQFQMHLSVTPSRSILPPTAAGLSMAPTATPATAGHLTDSSRPQVPIPSQQSQSSPWPKELVLGNPKSHQFLQNIHGSSWGLIPHKAYEKCHCFPQFLESEPLRQPSRKQRILRPYTTFYKK